MDITIGEIGLSTCDFTPARGEVYALFFNTPSAIGAVESTYALLAEMGFDGESIVAEHFYFQRDFGRDRLLQSLLSAALREHAGRSAIVVIPGLSPGFIGSTGVDEADVLGCLFELRRQLPGGGNAPCFVPFHSSRVGDASCESVKRAAEVVGFVVCDVEGNSGAGGDLGASEDAAIRMAAASLVREATGIIEESREGGCE